MPQPEFWVWFHSKRDKIWPFSMCLVASDIILCVYTIILCNISLPRNLESSFSTTLYKLFFRRTKRHLWSSSVLSASWQHCYWYGAVEDWRVIEDNMFRIALNQIILGQLVTIVPPQRTNYVPTISSIILIHCNAIRKKKSSGWINCNSKV